jgi:hypothetical protein
MLILTASGPLWAQFLADPNDEIYLFLSLWERKGLIDHLPSLRPYPLQLVGKALQEVMAKGEGMDAELAEGFLKSFQRESFPFPLRFSLFEDNQLKSGWYQGRLGFDIDSTGILTDYLSYSIGNSTRLEKKAGAEVYRRWANEFETTVFGEASLAGRAEFEIDSVQFLSFGLLTGALFIGTENLYFQAGLNRSSFGPVSDSPVLGPQAPQAGHFSLTWRNEWFSFSSALLELSARYGIRPDGTTYVLKKEREGTYPSKYLAVQSVDIYLIDWLSIGVFESIMFGGRLSPLYFLPIGLYIQGYMNDWDNAFIGGRLQISLPFSVFYDFLLYVDDVRAADLLRLNFDSNQHKVALQTGLSWIMPVDFLNIVRLEYLMITPYMYTHSAHQPLDYLQYTHHGKHLGSILEPNSDQLSFSAYLMPLSWLDFEVWIKKIRHGNGSDYGAGSVDGDGSIFDDGYLTNGTPTFLGPSSFLTQETLEEVFQVGLTLRFRGTGKSFSPTAAAGYTFEYLRHRDLNPSAPLELNHIFNINVGFSYRS